MEIGKKLRQLRESKGFSQGVIEKRTGLLRCYTSRVENGHTVPSYETLLKLASALEVPMYRLFVDEVNHKELKFLVKNEAQTRRTSVKRSRELRPFIKLLSKMDERSQKLLTAMAQQMVKRSR